jgi:hypothetical protein
MGSALALANVVPGPVIAAQGKPGAIPNACQFFRALPYRFLAGNEPNMEHAVVVANFARLFSSYGRSQSVPGRRPCKANELPCSLSAIPHDSGRVEMPDGPIVEQNLQLWSTNASKLHPPFQATSVHM